MTNHTNDDRDVLAAFFATERLMSARAFAALIGVKPETEAQMRARRHTPPFFRSGSTAFYRFDDVAKWLTKHRIASDGVNNGERQAIRDILG